MTKDPDVIAFSSHNGTVEICTRNVRDERLKATSINNVTAVDCFASTFIQSQDASKKVKPKNQERKFVVGERYSIVLGEKKDDDGMMYFECSPIRTLHEGKCEIKEEELVKGIYTHELIEYLYEQDFIKGAELVDDEAPPLFSIKEAYKTYCKKLAESDLISRRVYEARVVGIFKGETPDKDRVRLISDKGYAGLMRVNGDYHPGNIVIVYTVSMPSFGGKMFINMDIPDFDFEDGPDRFDEGSVLDDFAVTKEVAMANLESESKDEPPSIAAGFTMVRQIALIMALSKADNSMARYRNLLSSAFIMNTVGDADWKNYLLSRAEFLGQCLRAAEGVPVKERKASFRLTDNENWIIKALGFLDRPEDMEGISSLIIEAEDDKEKEIAKLLMIYSLSYSSPDDVKSGSEDVRKRLCNVLGIADHFKGIELKGGGKYGKGELANVEFKASYVMSNKDGKPDLFRQGRGQVFEAVCGFMNKDGGTVYIGVNNYGDPLTAEDYGLQGDLAWFRNNFDTVKKLRSIQLGHPVPQPKDLDTYCLFLNDEVELYFKPSVRNCITISPTGDMDAIKIEVRPSEFEIVKLYEDNTWTNGTVYVRNGEETLPMSGHDQKQRLMKLRSVGKVEQFILTLTEAIDKKHKVILKDYASSNSNEVKDRFVVPINLVYNNENLWAYDLDKKEAREFRLSRISSIETDIEDAEYTHAFKHGEADVFRWINPKLNYHIKLKMSIAALNCLREEYPNAWNLTDKELYQISPERWILDTTLHGLGAVRRFYLGLADQIEILETEDSDKLRDEIRAFIEKNI